MKSGQCLKNTKVHQRISGLLSSQCFLPKISFTHLLCNSSWFCQSWKYENNCLLNKPGKFHAGLKFSENIFIFSDYTHSEQHFFFFLLRNNYFNNVIYSWGITDKKQIELPLYLWKEPLNRLTRSGPGLCINKGRS